MTASRSSVIGVDVGGTKLLIVAGESEQRSETGPAFSPADLVTRLRAFIESERLQPPALGIAVPGLVDADGRVTACDGLPALAGWSAREDLADLGARVVVINDVNAALAEEMHDAPPDVTGGVVMAGTSLGAAFVVNGKALSGATGFAGEIGYIPLITPTGVMRLDELAGGAFIAAKLGVTAARLAELGRDNDSRALAAIRDGGAALGSGLAAVINLLNPSRLAVGGGALALPGYWDAARSAAERHSIPELWRACTLSLVRAGTRVVALGARRCAMNGGR